MNKPVPDVPRKRRIWLKRLITLVLSTLLTGFVLEVWLRTQLAAPFPDILRTTTVSGLPHQLRPNFTTPYFGIQVETNSHGFRGPEFTARQPGTRRIALLGDSITFGHVAHEQTIGAHLENTLREGGGAAEVLSFGVPGYDANHLALILETEVLRVAPDDIVYVFAFDDAPLSGPTHQANIPHDHLVDPKAAFPLRSALLELLGRVGKAGMRRVGMSSVQGFVAETLDNYRQGGADRLREAIEKMRRLCGKHDIRFFVALAPTMANADANPFAEIEAGFRELCRELELPFVDLRDAFTPDEHLGRFHVGLFDNHPNGEANRRMAALLAEKLRK